eukprot:9498816-Pyramimonas_sp.AAC.1
MRMCERGRENAREERTKGEGGEKRPFQLGLTSCAILLMIEMIRACACAGNRHSPNNPLDNPARNRTTPPGQSPRTTLPGICFPYNMILLL